MHVKAIERLYFDQRETWTNVHTAQLRIVVHVDFHLRIYRDTPLGMLTSRGCRVLFFVYGRVSSFRWNLGSTRDRPRARKLPQCGYPKARRVQHLNLRITINVPTTKTRFSIQLTSILTFHSVLFRFREQCICTRQLKHNRRFKLFFVHINVSITWNKNMENDYSHVFISC